MAKPYDSLVFELSSPGRTAFSLPECDVPEGDPAVFLPRGQLREVPPALPELSEPDVVRHYTRLSQLNFSVDTHFYPLGSCTMKYNPRVNEEAARLPGFACLHPLTPAAAAQGALALLFDLAQWLADLAGMDEVTLQPAAGAQGELTGILAVRAYHLSRGEGRRVVLVPDSAHGTNPATTAQAGYEVVPLRSGPDGRLDPREVERLLSDDVACLMVTQPNTLGLFEPDLRSIAGLCHHRGVQVYMDGANLNALLGLVRPGDLGFDLCHFNLHKTFSTPHGGGGPGAGPVGVKSHLAPFLPVPAVVRKGRGYGLDWDRPRSIGKVTSFWGNFGVCVRAYAYLCSLGAQGVRAVAENAVLNANYVAKRLEGHYDRVAPGRCMHECVVSARRQKGFGAGAGEIAKRLLDLGFYAPTTYFPLVVEEALMIEPTETESKETLDSFCDALVQIAREVETGPAWLHDAPATLPVRRLDQALAARHPKLRWSPAGAKETP